MSQNGRRYMHIYPVLSCEYRSVLFYNAYLHRFTQLKDKLLIFIRFEQFYVKFKIEIYIDTKTQLFSLQSFMSVLVILIGQRLNLLSASIL